MFEFLSAAAAFLAALIAVRGQTWDDAKQGRFKYTWKGVLAIIIATAAFIFSGGSAYYKSIEQQVQVANQQAHLGVSKETKDYVKEQLRVLEDHTKKLGETLDYSQRLTKRQEEQVEESRRMSEKLEEQLSLLGSLSELQNRQYRLSENLTAQQRKQIQQLVQLSLDRDLSGVEVSFKPSAKHWLKIAAAFDKIPPIDPTFPYRAATIRAERAGAFWNIHFIEIQHLEGKGTIKPPSVSTEAPENKEFENVISAALAEFSIKWGNSEELITVVSRNGDYPTSIEVSKNKIAFIFRPPQLKLGLGYLQENAKVTVRGHKDMMDGLVAEGITEIRLRSLDYKASFNQIIKLDWKYKRGDIHLEKWMPYISGSHDLNIDWKNLRK